MKLTRPKRRAGYLPYHMAYGATTTALDDTPVVNSVAITDTLNNRPFERGRSYKECRYLRNFTEFGKTLITYDSSGDDVGVGAVSYSEIFDIGRDFNKSFEVSNEGLCDITIDGEGNVSFTALQEIRRYHRK
jgi:hypothetical protein